MTGTDSLNEIRSADARDSLHWILPMLLSAMLLLPFLGSRGNLDGHEVLVAQTAREMLRSGDYIVPRFSGEPRLKKPPLAYWLAAISYELTGRIDEFSARLPVAVAMLLSAGLVAWFACKCFGPATGLLAGLLHATMYWTIAYGKVALVDGILTLLSASAIVVAAIDRVAPLQWTPTAIRMSFWTLCGLAVLAKGPVAVAVVWPTVALYRCLRGSRDTDCPLLLHRGVWLGLSIFGLLASLWPALVLARHPDALKLWYGQSAGRFLVYWGKNSRPWYYYFYQTAFLTLPWTGAWLGELCFTVRDRWRRGVRLDEHRLLLWLWFVVTLVFFSVSQGKREHYILPGLPPLSVLAALGLVRCRPVLRHWAASRAISVRYAARIATILAVVSGAVVFVATIDPLTRAIGALVAVGTFAVKTTLEWASGDDSSPVPRMLLALIVLAVLIFESCVSPEFHWRSGAIRLFARNREKLQQADKVVQFGSNDRWTVFPLDRPMAWERTTEAVREQLSADMITLILLPEHRLEELRSDIAIEVLDRMGDDRSTAEQSPSQAYVLVRPSAPATIARREKSLGTQAQREISPESIAH